MSSLNPWREASTLLVMVWWVHWVLTRYGRHQTQRFQQLRFQLVPALLVATIASICRGCWEGQGCCSLSKKRLKRIWRTKNLWLKLRLRPLFQSKGWQNLNALFALSCLLRTIRRNVVVNCRSNGGTCIRLDCCRSNRGCKNLVAIGSPLPRLLNH